VIMSENGENGIEKILSIMAIMCNKWNISISANENLSSNNNENQ
jgi:hypothetical protein